MNANRDINSFSISLIYDIEMGWHFKLIDEYFDIDMLKNISNNTTFMYNIIGDILGFDFDYTISGPAGSLLEYIYKVGYPNKIDNMEMLLEEMNNSFDNKFISPYILIKDWNIPLIKYKYNIEYMEKNGLNPYEIIYHKSDQKNIFNIDDNSEDIITFTIPKKLIIYERVPNKINNNNKYNPFYEADISQCAKACRKLKKIDVSKKIYKISINITDYFIAKE